jgi:hypothetical protein
VSFTLCVFHPLCLSRFVSFTLYFTLPVSPSLFPPPLPPPPSGTSGGITNGGEQITITGRNFVGRRGGDDASSSATEILTPTTADILVRYGGPTGNPDATPVYYMDNCVLALPCALNDECSITCLTSEGVGAELNVEILIYKDAASATSSNNGASAPYATGSRITYAAPLISEYEGPGADRVANTVGGEDLIIKGKWNSSWEVGRLGGWEVGRLGG